MDRGLLFPRRGQVHVRTWEVRVQRPRRGGRWPQPRAGVHPPRGGVRVQDQADGDAPRPRVLQHPRPVGVGEADRDRLGISSPPGPLFPSLDGRG